MHQLPHRQKLGLLAVPIVTALRLAMNGAPTGSLSGSAKLDMLMDRVASSRPPLTSSRTNSASSSSRHSVSNSIPASADPGYSRKLSSAASRMSVQCDYSDSEHINAQLYNAMPPPKSNDGVTHRARHGDDWAEKGASTRVVQTVVNGVRQEKVIRKGVRDFNFARTLGEGSYSTVIAATDRQTLREYAIKVLDKRHIIKEKKVKYVNIEKNTLFRLGDHPGVVRLYYTFQDESSLYFVLDLAANGELLGVLKKLTTFDEECARFYTAQILDAIDYMHSKGVIHRDLKPENVLLDDKMRVKIADFGTAKLLDLPEKGTTHEASSISGRAVELEGLEQSERANSFVGTAEYVSPELLTEKSTCKSSDLWALGCILYQLINGKPPFKASNEYQTFQKIVNLDYTIPPNFPPKAADLIKRLLVLDPKARLSVPEIRSHEFFAGINWKTLWKIPAPKLRPYRVQTAPILLNSQPPLKGPPPQGLSSRSRSSSYTPQQQSMPHRESDPSGHNAPLRPISMRLNSSNPSELDLQYAAVLSLPTERILRLGQVAVMTSDSDKKPGKFHKILHRKKTRTVMVTTHGRCLYLESPVDKKVRGEMLLTGPISTSVRQLDERQWVVETPSRSYLCEDASGCVPEWVKAINEANRLVSIARDSSDPSGREDKRKSRVGFGH